MAFNFKVWQEQVQQRLRGWKDSMVANGIDSIYATLATSALWPLAQAIVSEPLVAGSELMKLLGSIGTNLLANKVQSWKDKSSAADLREITLLLQHDLQQLPALRQEIDTVLQKLEVLDFAKAALPPPDHQWFEQTLRTELQRLGNITPLQNSGVLIADSEVSVGKDFVGGDKIKLEGTGHIVTRGHVVIAAEGAKVIIGEQPVVMKDIARTSDLGRYLEHLIARNRYLQLQGIRSGGRLVNIELENIYIALRATQQRTVAAEETWLATEAALAPGEWRKYRGEHPARTTETVTVSVNQALAEHRRLVVLGDPGSGKTTLLRYLALIYARDLAEANALVREKLQLSESGHLPILLQLRQIGAFLREHHASDDGTEGHAHVLEFLLQFLKNERIALPADFFDAYFNNGRAVILLDGLDEVADPDLRRRVSRLVEAFVQAYPNCRFVVTSRIVGYTGAARLGENFVTTTVQDFVMNEVEKFLHDWHRLVAIGQMGPGASAETYALTQTQQLLEAIRKNDRIRELAINPLMLTVIALVHRDRVKLPDRRAELYAEAVDVLLGKWDEARGVRELSIFPERPFDTGDKRLLLQSLALHLHERQLKEISAVDLREVLRDMFVPLLAGPVECEPALVRFLQVIEERTGLLAARGEGVYAFSHLTFQEYLAALAVAARDDYVEYSLQRAAAEWWREVILLEAGYLSTQSKERTTRLIQSLADLRDEPEPYHNLVLAAECLRDAGSNRVLGDLEAQLRKRLRQELDSPPPRGRFKAVQILVTKGMSPKAWAERRSAAARALSRVGGNSYWSLPYGEPEWVDLPAGEFWLGSESGYNHEQPEHRCYLAAFAIARTPITNAQYHLFVQATGQSAPRTWVDGRPPKNKESHPLVAVTWHEALAYCQWLSQKTGRTITLPSEAQWEKAARGADDKRLYPWGDQFEATLCNSRDLGLEDTTPVGIFPAGASPYGVLDMAGNVWEWTRSLWRKDASTPEFRYPYDPTNGRENLEAADDISRVVRGGSFYDFARRVRCSCRFGDYPLVRVGDFGFRVALSP
ncbi:MAG: SUMF1/EgtB/PvdO family nonheme iron enzyme [bacterium]